MKTFAAILLVAIGIMGIQASCPNQCSGHGRCTENDVCECYKQSGTTWRQRVGYTGSDCSQRTCPLGITFDQIQTNKNFQAIAPIKYIAGKTFAGVANTNAAPTFNVVVRNYELSESKNVDVRIASSASGTTTYQWKLDTQTAYSAPANLITSTNQCSDTSPCELRNNEGVTDTGIFISATGAASTFSEGNVFKFSFEHLEGRPYQPSESNSAHQETECSGRGACDRASGRCECYDGFAGESCHRTTCPNDCSGHGVCQDIRRFASDFGSAAVAAEASASSDMWNINFASSLSYDNAYDARKQMGCSCDDGFRGPDCSQVECPSGADPMLHYGGNGLDGEAEWGTAMDCSGRGLCDYSAGECQCFKGFYGERCEFQTNFV